MISQKRLKELLYYNETTGIFIRRISVSNKTKVGEIAGTTGSKGYNQISLDGKVYRSHRLAWLYKYGNIPNNCYIDHINRDIQDNRIVNLRAVSSADSAKNRGKRINNSSGVVGVSYTNRGNWVAQITINGKAYNLGTSYNFDEAVCIRLAVEQCVGIDKYDKETTAYLYVKNKIQGISND